MQPGGPLARVILKFGLLRLPRKWRAPGCRGREVGQAGWLWYNGAAVSGDGEAEMVRAILVGMLRQYVDGKDAVSLEKGAGRSVRDLIESLNIPSALVGAVLIGGQLVTKDYVLQDGQEVKLIALIGGG